MSITIKKNQFRSGVLGVSCFAISISHFPLVNAEEVSVNVTPARPISSIEATTAQDATENMLKHLATARQALDSGDADKAKIQLMEARAMLDRVRSQRPPAKVSYHLSIEKASAIGYQDMIKTLPSGEESKLTKAEEAMRKGDRQTAIKNLDEVGSGIAFVALNYTIDDIDAFVTKAIVSLDRGIMEDADKELRKARSAIEVDGGALAVKPTVKKK